MEYHNLLRLKKELFRKQRLTLFKKAYEIVRSSANVYLMIRRCNNYYFVFNFKNSIN